MNTNILFLFPVSLLPFVIAFLNYKYLSKFSIFGFFYINHLVYFAAGLVFVPFDSSLVISTYTYATALLLSSLTSIFWALFVYRSQQNNRVFFAHSNINPYAFNRLLNSRRYLFIIISLVSAFAALLIVSKRPIGLLISGQIYGKQLQVLRTENFTSSFSGFGIKESYLTFLIQPLLFFSVLLVLFSVLSFSKTPFFDLSRKKIFLFSSYISRSNKIIVGCSSLVSVLSTAFIGISNGSKGSLFNVFIILILSVSVASPSKNYPSRFILLLFPVSLLAVYLSSSIMMSTIYGDGIFNVLVESISFLLHRVFLGNLLPSLYMIDYVNIYGPIGFRVLPEWLFLYTHQQIDLHRLAWSLLPSNNTTYDNSIYTAPFHYSVELYALAGILGALLIIPMCLFVLYKLEKMCLNLSIAWPPSLAAAFLICVALYLSYVTNGGVIRLIGDYYLLSYFILPIFLFRLCFSTTSYPNN